MISLRPLAVTLTFISLVLLAGCSTTRSAHKGGGYYQDDGPEANPPSNVENTPDAVPRIEAYSSSTSKPYVAFGKSYVPVSGDQAFRQRGIASWYGKKFKGGKTANGETYDMYAMTAAHPTLPIPSYARVTRVATGKSVIVRVNDRGPFHSKRIIDLSYAAAAKLELIATGSGEVVVEAITNADIRNNTFKATKPAKPADTLTVDAGSPANALAVVPATRTPATGLPQTSLVSYSPATAPSTAGAANQIYLQFGAFSTEAAARQLAQKLNQQISQVESRPAQVDSGEKLYRVQIGPYPTRTDAVNASARIQTTTGMHPAIALKTS
jgi:rare lipoprotein A